VKRPIWKFAVMSTRQHRSHTSGPKNVLAGTGRSQHIAAKSVGSFVPRLTRQAFEKYGFSTATLITDWATIVGADLAKWTEPERLRWPKPVSARAETVDEPDQGRPGATLMLRVEPGRALDIQYRARQIVERINAYFGYRAIADVRLVQAPLTSAGRSEPRRPHSQVPAAAPPAALKAVADDSVRAALEHMAAGIAARAAERARTR
jgi:hypothetical protein